MKTNNRAKRWCCFILILLSFFSSQLSADTTTQQQAESVVKGWLKNDAQPLRMVLGQQIANTEIFSDADGQPIYYVVHLQPTGYVIVPADDLVEPIIAFVNDDTFDPSSESPLGSLVTQDLNKRLSGARGKNRTILSMAGTSSLPASKAKSKWEHLTSIANESGGESLMMGTPAIPDIRVEPLIQSQWNQGLACGDAC